MTVYDQWKAHFYKHLQPCVSATLNTSEVPRAGNMNIPTFFMSGDEPCAPKPHLGRHKSVEASLPRSIEVTANREHHFPRAMTRTHRDARVDRQA